MIKTLFRLPPRRIAGILHDERIGTVTGDGAYDTRRGHIDAKMGA